VQIQRPPDALGLTHHVPSGSIAVGAPILVDAGDRAVFVQSGRVLGVLGPGRHAADPAQIRFLEWAVRPGARALDCETWFVREHGTVDVDGELGDIAIEAVFDVEILDAGAVASQLVVGRSLDEQLDHQLFRALPGVLDRVRAGGWPDDLDQAAEALALAAESDGLGFAQLGARFAGFVELHLTEHAEDGPVGFVSGAAVLAQSRDGRWAPGTIARIDSGRFEILWDDGRRDWVTPYQVRPL
jgi:hypothetical protein